VTQTPSASATPPKPANPLVGPGLAITWIALCAALVAAPSGSLGGPLSFAVVMLGWVLSVMVHEFAHAAVAWLGGDRTIVEKGYLAFDPRRYGDLGVSLVLPLLALIMGGVGFPGGAVYIRNDLIRRRIMRSAAALAGPAASFAIFLGLVVGLTVWGEAGVSSAGALALYAALSVLAFLQLMGVMLNLLPLPGLDGFAVLRPYLPEALLFRSRRVEGIVMLGLLLLLVMPNGLGSQLFSAAARIGLAFGLNLDALQAGWRAFHFWQGSR